MSEPTRRERAAENLLRALRRASLCLEVDPDDARAIVDLIVDAVTERWRDKLSSRLAEAKAEYDRRLAESPDAEVIRHAFPQTEEDVGTCERCGEREEFVRPGVSRRTCQCYGRNL